MAIDIDSPNEIGAAVSAAVSEARSEGVIAGVELIDGAVADANARAEQAEAIATQVIEGAMETERGNRIAALESEIFKWQDALAALRSLVENLQAEISTIKSSQSAVAGIVIAETLSQSTPALSPTVAEPLEQAAEVAEVIPEALSQSDAAESPAPPIVRKVRRLI